MRKKTLLIMTASIAAIITTSVLGHALTNRVFAQQVGQTQAGQILGKDHVPHVGQDHIIVDPDHIVVFEPGHSPIHLPPVHIEP